MAAFQNEDVNRMIQQDWANREYIEIITGSIKKIADFLNSFDRSCRGRLALLNEKLTTLERTIEYLEAKVSKGELNGIISQPNSTTAAMTSISNMQPKPE
ncbi:PREDICTED: probable protein BRICK1-B [Rhagoletis zephyria]|uniref:probable protein BRICK1-B n=1 Tax=Rhagoletis zephyria TaxID=28612 RepID=UPI0008117E5C|nr:PREDICTED: probable protein BRICK1-B [Rhagoletis zephyria]KAH9403895.1 putative protein BRICK1 [Tyrophagus putrescentiae]